MLEKNGSIVTVLAPLAKTVGVPRSFTLCKMPWMWQGRVEADTKMHTIYQLRVHEQGAYLKTEQTLDTRTGVNKYRKFIGGETGLTWPMQFHIIINSRIAQGWFFSPSNSLRSCTLLWWIFCTITDYCHGNRCITWQLCYLRDKKQLLKETGILQEWGYLFSFFLLASYCFRSRRWFSHGCGFRHFDS